jgi:hypothetical protein
VEEVIQIPPKKKARRMLIMDETLDAHDSTRYSAPKQSKSASVNQNKNKSKNLKKTRFLPRVRNKKTLFPSPLQFEKATMLKEIRDLKKSLKKCHESNKKYKEELKCLRKKTKAVEDAERHMSPLAREFFRNEIFNSMRHPKGRIYSKKIKDFSFQHSYYSQRAYQHLSDNFCLPTGRSLINHVSKIGCLPGHLHNVYKQLGEDIKSKKFGRRCTLVMDGFSCRKASGFDPQTKGFSGQTTPIEIVKDGVRQIEEPAIASSCLVFLLVGLDGKWKRVVGYWFMNKECSLKMKTLLTEALTISHEHGVDIKAIVSDGLPANLKVMKDLGANISLSNMKNHFPHPRNGNKLVTVYRVLILSTHTHILLIT